MLTDIQVRQAKLACKLADSHGLLLEVTRAGSKKWRYRYRLDGKENTFALGDYPGMGLQAARQARDSARELVKQGIHPAHHRASLKGKNVAAAANTFRVVAEEWLADKTPRIAPYYSKQIRTGLDTDIYPTIGDLPIKSVTTAHVLDIINKAKNRGAATVAINLRQWISQVFLHAIVTGKADTDPAQSLRGFIKRPPINHAKAWKAGDLKTFKVRLGGKGNHTTYLALELMMLTFVRTAELRKAEWAEFDLERRLWSIPAEKMKMRRTHIVPLSRQAMATLVELKKITGNGRYLFPNTRRPNACMSGTTLNRAIEYLGYPSGYWSGHDFRATAKTHLLEQGWSDGVTEAQLAHSPRGQTAAAYNHAVYVKERHEMMQAWADWLDTLVSGFEPV